jgi:hypothetical protein
MLWLLISQLIGARSPKTVDPSPSLISLIMIFENIHDYLILVKLRSKLTYMNVEWGPLQFFFLILRYETYYCLFLPLI